MNVRNEENEPVDSNATNHAAGTNGASTESAVESGLEQVEGLKSQLEKARNEYIYLKAEFDTYKRNSIRERSDLNKYNGERVLTDLLGVLDNFDRAMAIKPTSENFENVFKGIEMTATELRSLLAKFGVSEVPALGENFNPVFHEALSTQINKEFSEGQVCHVFRKPYKMHDKLIRTGQVVVAKSGDN